MSESKSVNRCNSHLLVEHPDPGLNLPVKEETDDLSVDAIPTLDQLYEMFPNLKQSAIVLLCNLHGPAEVAEVIMSENPHLTILSALQRKTLETEEYKVKIDEEDLIAHVIALYKIKKFRLKQPIQVTFSGQPAVDAGGIRRQLF